jgi:hypothetical protein
VKNKEALKAIDKVIAEIDQNNIEPEEISEKLKRLRTYAVEYKKPVVAKALRLAYEHIEENESFIIPIPTDEPLEGEEDDVQLITGDESLVYLLNLIKNSSNKMNLQEIREYIRLMEI